MGLDLVFFSGSIASKDKDEEKCYMECGNLN